MAETLAEYLEGKKCKGFKPVPRYFKSGDYVSHFIRDERCYAKRVDALLTTYHSSRTHELVGCKIKGVKRLLWLLKAFGVAVDAKSVRLGYLFLAAALEVPKSTANYEDWAQFAKDELVPGEDLPWSEIEDHCAASELAECL